MIDLRTSVSEAQAKLQPIEINGKSYTKVVDRVNAFRETIDGSIITELIHYGARTGDKIVVKASIMDAGQRIVATGMAEQVRGEGVMGSSAPLELAETKAIGRALACFGLAGGEYASANELPQVSAHAGPGSRAGTPEPASGVSGLGQNDGAHNEPVLESGLVPGTGPDTINRRPAWVVIGESMIAGLQVQQDVDMLKEYYRNNLPLIDELADKDPAQHKLLMDAFSNRKKQLQGEVNGEF